MYLASSLGTDKILFFIYVSAYAGFAIPLFTLNLAYVNDHMPKEKFVAAGSGMQIIFGLGAMIGPFLCSLLMNKIGTSGFFIHLLFFHLIIGFFGLLGIITFSFFDVSSEDLNVPSFFFGGWANGSFILWLLIIIQSIGSMIGIALLTKAYQMADTSYLNVFEYSFFIFWLIAIGIKQNFSNQNLQLNENNDRSFVE